MHDLEPHIDFRIRRLQDEADDRRLAGSVARDGPRSGTRPVARRLATTTAIALAIGIVSSGAYLAIGAEPTGSGPAPISSARGAIDLAPAPPPAVDRSGLPPSGGLLVHR